MSGTARKLAAMVAHSARFSRRAQIEFQGGLLNAQIHRRIDDDELAYCCDALRGSSRSGRKNSFSASSCRKRRGLWRHGSAVLAGAHTRSNFLKGGELLVIPAPHARGVAHQFRGSLRVRALLIWIKEFLRRAPHTHDACSPSLTIKRIWNPWPRRSFLWVRGYV